MMGSKYPSLSSAEVVRRLNRLGFVFKSQRGSHAKYVKYVAGLPTKIAIVPMHTQWQKVHCKNIVASRIVFR